jgi:hypothetical protein
MCFRHFFRRGSIKKVNRKLSKYFATPAIRNFPGKSGPLRATAPSFRPETTVN